MCAPPVILKPLCPNPLLNPSLSPPLSPAMGNPKHGTTAYDNKLAATRERKARERLRKLARRPAVKGLLQQALRRWRAKLRPH